MTSEARGGTTWGVLPRNEVGGRCARGPLRRLRCFWWPPLGAFLPAGCSLLAVGSCRGHSLGHLLLGGSPAVGLRRCPVGELLAPLLSSRVPAWRFSGAAERSGGGGIGVASLSGRGGRLNAARARARHPARHVGYHSEGGGGRSGSGGGGVVDALPPVPLERQPPVRGGLCPQGLAITVGGDGDPALWPCRRSCGPRAPSAPPSAGVGGGGGHQHVPAAIGVVGHPFPFPPPPPPTGCLEL